ncbi:Re/Si-specific NAD(P)(+) transhydrogenase subunit alpha [bacterium]|nr:Re/Si-specific NAD(P)(+) transhydrogenase subunit alpha [bacterium]
MATIGVPNEQGENEFRVSINPDGVKRLLAQGHKVVVEKGAGEAAGALDRSYEEIGATMGGASDAWGSEVVLTVGPVGKAKLKLLTKGAILIGSIDPFLNLKMMDALAKAGITAMAMEFLPRISRAQSMDTLSSQSNIAGYKAVLMAADKLPRIFPMMTTAAGTLSPARMVILGAGVAGLQAIATARRLGARVEVSDIRPETKEEVESLGGRFIEVDMEEEETSGDGGYARAVSDEFLARQREILSERIAAADAVVTTALVPGRKAPVLVSKEMVEGMKPGSVVVDMAARNGGNCELTSPGETVVHQGVSILGPTNIPALVPVHASQVYARNLVTLLAHMTTEGVVGVETDDEIVGPMVVTKGGEIVESRIKEAMA